MRQNRQRARAGAGRGGGSGVESGGSGAEVTDTSLTTEKERMNESSTACGNLRTNFSAPPSGDGSAPPRSVSQCTK